MTTGAPARVLLALALVPAVSSAAELRLRPSVSLSQMHDDNLFAARGPVREADDVSRLGAGLAVRRRSSRMTMQARYDVEAEVFRRHPELNRAVARQDAALDVEWVASKRLGVSLSAGYLDTQTPSELNILTGLEVGRQRGQRMSTGALFTHRVGPLTAASLEHRFSHDRIVGGPSNVAQDVLLGFERRIGPSDRGRLTYRAQKLAFGTGATLSHILTLGWKKAVSPAAQLELEAGPRWTGGRLAAEVTAGVRQRLRKGQAAIDYVHSHTTVLGQPGPVTVDGVRASLSHQVVGPLWISASPGVFRVAGVGPDSILYQVAGEVAWRVARNVTLSGTHQFGRQEGGLTQGSASVLTHNTFVLALTRRAGE